MKDQPIGIKLITLATTIRWIGWGFVEGLLPVFLFSFAHSYAETGVFQSIYELVFLAVLPFVGMLADKISAKTILIIGLSIYPFIGFSYFWAGVTGMALFVVIARALNGAAYAIDSVGREVYFRGHAQNGEVSKVFGYFDTITNVCWIAAVLFSLLLIQFLKIHQLFLFIIPTTIISILIIIVFLKRHNHKSLKEGVKEISKDGFLSGFVRDFKSWTAELRFIGFLNFFLGIISAAAYFFIPIYIYTESHDLSKVIILEAVFALPGAFGFLLSRFTDKYKNTAIITGLISISTLLFLFTLTQNYILQIALSLGVGVSLELIYLASQSISNKISSAGHYGKMASSLSGMGALGTIIGPIAFGFLIDKLNNSNAFLAISVLTVFVLLFFLRVKKNG